MKLEITQHLQPLTSQTLHQIHKDIHLILFTNHTTLAKHLPSCQTTHLILQTICNDPYKFDQPSNYNYNYTNPIHPYQHNDFLRITTEKQKFRDEISQIHDLCDLNAMHLAQCNKGQPPSSPYNNCLPHSLNLDQVTNHTHYCPCCIFLQKQILYLSEDISWIEYLLTRPHPIPPLTRYNIVRFTSSVPYHTPFPSSSNK